MHRWCCLSGVVAGMHAGVAVLHPPCHGRTSGGCVSGPGLHSACFMFGETTPFIRSFMDPCLPFDFLASIPAVVRAPAKASAHPSAATQRSASLVVPALTPALVGRKVVASCMLAECTSASTRKSPRHLLYIRAPFLAGWTKSWR